jgi:hypothetical protein
MTNPELADEYAETEVLTPKRGKLRAADDDASAQSAYSEYVQEFDRLLKAETTK